MHQRDYLGTSLATVLGNYIAEAQTEERTRVAIINEMAEASGLDVFAVEGILAGSNEGVTMPVLEAFAVVLDCSLLELEAAARDDGIPLDDPAPAPPPASNNTKTLRRRLELKLKAG